MRPKSPRQLGEVRDLDAGDIVEIPGIVGIGADTVRYLADSSGKAVDMLMEARPESGNAGAAFVAEAIADAGDQNGLGGLETRRRDAALRRSGTSIMRALLDWRLTVLALAALAHSGNTRRHLPHRGK